MRPLALFLISSSLLLGQNVLPLTLKRAVEIAQTSCFKAGRKILVRADVAAAARRNRALEAALVICQREI